MLPSTAPVGSSSGRRPASRPERRTSSGTYPGDAAGRLSVSQDRIIEAGVAATRPRCITAAARVGPEHAVTDRAAVGGDRNGRAPLARDADPTEVVDRRGL